MRMAHLLPPEMAHGLAIHTLKRTPLGVLGNNNQADPRLNVTLFGQKFPTPFGVAAGFDKNAEVWRQGLALGFGHVEIGTVTPKPQVGNPQPRVFRLPEDKAVINRMGFPGAGQQVVQGRLTDERPRMGVLGVNIGRNKDQADPVIDYVEGVRAFASKADYLTVNISSPNTPGLRQLQDKAYLSDLLAAVLQERASHSTYVPIMLKVAPDLDHGQITDIIEAVLNTRVQSKSIDGIIVSNTTVARFDTLNGTHKGQSGGLSGAPLFAMSTAILKRFRQEIGSKIPLIGVGGIQTADDAWQKMRAGASLVQVYTGLIYQGLGLVKTLDQDLIKIMDNEGVERLTEIIGCDVD